MFDILFTIFFQDMLQLNSKISLLIDKICKAAKKLAKSSKAENVK